MRKYMNVTLYKSVKNVSKKVFGPAFIGGSGVLLAATGSFATAADMFAAVDITTFDAQISTVLVGLIGISLMGAAYVYVKRALPGRL
jgi:drug/metabolite transporter (DMT)-like permease